MKPNITVVAGEYSVKLEYNSRYAGSVRVFKGEQELKLLEFTCIDDAKRCFDEEHAKYIKNAKADLKQVDYFDNMTDKECSGGSCPIR